MEYQICYENWKNTFSVPCGVTDEYLAGCGAVQLKVLLLVLRHQSETISPEMIAKSLSVPAADIRDALNYWANTGILKAVSDSDPAGKEEPVAPPAALPATDPVPTIPKAQSPKPSPARMTASEIHELTQRQPVIRSLLHETEAILGKTLTSTDISTVISLYDWAGISANVILMAVAYCTSIDKRNLRYIEKTALSWQEMGLESDEEIGKYLDRQSTAHKREQEVQSAFGIHGRRLTAKEQGCISKWYGEFHFSIDMIRLAYEKTVDNTGKVSFPYIHKILSAWHEKGFRTPEEASSESAPRQSGQKDGKKEYSFDLEEFEQRHRWHVPTVD
ncbi:MAG: DnaD domain protein [Oscillospiraceae bacterium]|nr:DnaD domain protein [Oscillospiraceae bacterium]